MAGEPGDPPLLSGYGDQSGTQPFDAGAVAAGSLSGYSRGGREATVLRFGTVGGLTQRGFTSPSNPQQNSQSYGVTYKRQRSSSLTDYNGEFFHRWADANFQTWLGSRMAAMGIDDRSVEGAYKFWGQVGEMLAVPVGGTRSPTGFDGTPEQYIEYMANGGKKLSEQEVEGEINIGQMVIDPETGEAVDPYASEMLAEENPITTVTDTQRITINPAAANAAVDDFSKALLGRMATQKEMARLRKAMNKYLAKNPTVSTTTTDATDPNNVSRSTSVKDGPSASDAANLIEMRMARSSEGQAFNAGKMFEDAFRMMG